jgi:hypothetical protein
MPPPRRRAPLDTQESVLEDLLLARDMVGLARCGADRLQGTLSLMFGSHSWSDALVLGAREFLSSAVERSSAAFATLHPGDACAQAAAESVRNILLQPGDGRLTANALRRQARERHGCQIADDSLRKREQPVLEMISKTVFSELKARLVTEMPTYQAVLETLKPFADVASGAVALAAKRFSQRAALQDDSILPHSVAVAIWAVAQLGVLPVYGLQRLQAMGVTRLDDAGIEYLLLGIIQVPFVEEPNDLNELATAIRPGEDPDEFYNRLRATPVMRPVVERFVAWVSTHDPKKCLVDSNDVMIGYCRPHYYAVLCEQLAEAADEYGSGELQRDLYELLQPLLPKSKKGQDEAR